MLNKISITENPEIFCFSEISGLKRKKRNLWLVDEDSVVKDGLLKNSRYTEPKKVFARLATKV